MAAALVRCVSTKVHFSKGFLGLQTSRLYSAPVQEEADPLKGKIISNEVQMPDGLGHAVGAERWELLNKQAGNDDPYEMKVKKRAKGTKDEPTMIPSVFNKRLIGCICEDDSMTVVWMYLHRGEPKRCQCGFWFKITDVDKSKYVFA